MTSALCIAAHRHEPERPRQAAPGLRCCASCVDDLDRRLASVPRLLADLELALIPGGRGHSEPLTGTPEKAVPYNDLASEARRKLLSRFHSWTAMVAEEVGADLPADLSPTSLSAWHRTRLDWIAAQPWCDDYAAELREDTSRARGVLAGQRSKRVPLGACPDDDRCDVTTRTGLRCAGTLTAHVDLHDDLLPAEVACTVCGRSYAARDLAALGRRVTGGRSWLTTAEAAIVLGLSQNQTRMRAIAEKWDRRDSERIRPSRWCSEDIDKSRARYARAESETA